MSIGFITWFLVPPAPNRALEWLGDVGAHLHFSGTNDRVTMLDHEGYTHIASPDDLRRALASDAPSTSFKMWFTGADDMPVTVAREVARLASGQPIGSVTCYFDAIEDEHVDATIASIPASLELVGPSVIGIVADRDGATEDFDWDAYIVAPASRPPIPDVLVLPKARADAAHAESWGGWADDVPAPGFVTLQ